MATTALATAEVRSIATVHELEVDDVIHQVQKIQHVMEAVMKPGEHYGVIPGTGTKPTLLKPGAEKLCLVFRLDPQYEVTQTQSEGAHLTVVSRCTLYHIPTGNRMGSGMGSCSTKESKYAYRQAKRSCPACGQEAIIKGKAEYGGGWLCLQPDTPVLYSDYVWRPISEVKPGDQLLGFDEIPGGWNVPRKFRPTMVEHVWASKQPTIRLITDDADVLTTRQHRWLRHRPSNGPHWMPTERLELGRSLRNIGVHQAPPVTDIYRMGYLSGMTLGDGTMRYGDGYAKPYYWRVALSSKDEIVLGRIVAYLAALGIDAYIRPFNGGPYSRAHQRYPLKKVDVRAIGKLAMLHTIIQPQVSLEYDRGFVAGFFDAEGTGTDHLRVYQKDTAVLEVFQKRAAALGFRFDIAYRTDGRSWAGLVGSTLDRIRFFNCVQPALLRKAGVHDVTMHHLQSRIAAIEDGPSMDMIDIQTSTGTFFANGLATHNCFKKQGGCGAKFGDTDSVITGQAVGRIANPDLPDQYNTILKMANKRSLVAAVLNVTAASDLLTQDLEDMPVPPPQPTPPSEKPPPAPPGAFVEGVVNVEEETPPETWELVVSDFVARFDEASARSEAEGWRQQWLKAKETVPAEGHVLVQAAINRAKTRLA